ncbi:MAG: 2-C-methyl-D-erythritol 2,4-cyclodiphosphate synthase [Lentisphaeria bacterium]|nr:2-C-methyl-D-erythritol 2,4-cyclodiphosphate synthase [Lentisphaeria bacterium]
MENLRIGQGYDVHPMAPNRPCILGGVTIPTEDGRGPDGHSDADVLIHAVIDAMLGSCAVGDIGTLFPDTDPSLENADSTEMLREVIDALNAEVGWKVVNLDCTIFAARPKIGPHVNAIRLSLSKLLNTSIDRISVQSKSGNRCLGMIGQGDAIGASATILATINERTY